MQIVLLLLFVLQSLDVGQFTSQDKRFVNIVKREVRSSSLQYLNRYTKTYENGGENLVLNTPNLTLIDSFLSIISTNKSKSSVREHTTWLVRQIPLSDYQEIARFDSIKHRFILHPQNNHSYSINAHTGQLTILNINDTDLLQKEIISHAQSGLSQGDDILHDIFRFIRLSITSINCTTNITINLDQSFEIECTIEYEFSEYDDLDFYQPAINLAFYRKENHSMYVPIDPLYLNEIEDLPMGNNGTFSWKRVISYTIQSLDREETNREYLCIVIPDSTPNDDLFQNNKRSCRTRINIRNGNDSTVIISRFDQLNLIDLFIIILIVFSVLLFLISFSLCIAARQYHKKRLLQIKPQNKSLTLPLSTNQIFSNNNEIKSEECPLRSFENFSSRHKPGCPKYLPSSEYNLLSSDLFTHTTIDNIKKIILPDMPEPTDLFDDQTYIHFYIPSKTENISIKKVH